MNKKKSVFKKWFNSTGLREDYSLTTLENLLQYLGYYPTIVM